MTEEKCIFINSVSPYFLMLERINENLLDIINNILMKKGEPYYVSEKIFSLSIDLLRLLPYKVDKNNEEIYLDINSGILLIKEEDISFFKDEYQDIINKNGNLLIQIIKIRNKYMHEPHNIKWSMIIGNDKDYNIWFKYKRFNQFDKKYTYIINICELKKLVISLNDIFNNVCKLALSIIDNSSDFIKRHPYSKFLKKLYFDTYNEILKGDIND